MEQLSNLNLNSITSSLSEGIKGLMESQNTNELADEIFGRLSSDTTDKNDANVANAANSSSSSSSSSSSGPMIIMKKKPVAKEPAKKEPPKNIEIPDVKEALNEYFKLKQKYENQIAINKKKIINNPALSKREKRTEYLKLKPKCINCERPGGTKFSIRYFPETDDENSYREYIAVCGIVADPCNLNIKIQIGKTESLPTILNTFQKDIRDLKNKVIDDKNKLLFGYITTEEALDQFEKIRDDINFYSSFYEGYLEHYNFVVDNDEKKQELSETITNSYIEINNIKDCIKKLNETDNVQFARDAVNIYTNTLKPLLEKIRHLKYNEYNVLHNDETNNCHLIQNTYTIENLLYSSFQNKVVSYNVGRETIPVKKPALTIMNDLGSSSSSIPVDIPSNKIAQTATANANKGVEIPKDEPIYGRGKDGVEWNLPEYNQLWDNLPIKLKNVLKTDKDWMTEFMFNCVNAKAKREPCKFTAPTELKIPPTELPNGEYDFGVQIYNEEFKKLGPSLQKTYLTFYTVKDGVTNSGLLLNSMNDLVAKAVDFNRGFF
jgi:hypothetical protein